MKRFVWRLQRVLDIKTKEEQVKKAELIKMTEKVVQARNNLLAQKRILDTIIDDLRGQHPKKRLSKQEFFLRCSVTNDAIIKELQEKLSELESAQKQKIAEVLKIRRFKKGLEKLQAQAKERYIKEQEKLEQKELDERTTIGSALKLIR
jgi:flagellar FliJ protein